MQIAGLALLALRIFVDGPFSFTIGGQKATAVISAILVLLAVWNSLRRRTFYLLQILLVSSVVVISSFIASYTYGPAPLEEAFRVVSIFAVFLIFSSQDKPLNQKVFMRVLGSLTITSAILGILQQISSTGIFVNNVWRFAGLFAHPNSAALFYGIVIVFMLHFLGASKENRGVFSITTLSMSIVGLVMTLSIGGIFAAAISSVIVLGFSNQKRSRSTWLSFLVLVAGVSSLALPGIASRAIAISSASAYLQGDQTNSLVWRLEHWKYFWPYFIESPFFGVGFGSTTSGLLTRDGLWPHNEYLRFAVELGIFGFAITALFLFMTLKSLRKQSALSEFWASRVAFSCLAGELINAFTENTFTYSASMILLAILIGESVREASGASRLRPNSDRRG
jgi:O-antigen ligase